MSKVQKKGGDCLQREGFHRGREEDTRSVIRKAKHVAHERKEEEVMIDQKHAGERFHDTPNMQKEGSYLVVRRVGRRNIGGTAGRGVEEFDRLYSRAQIDMKEMNWGKEAEKYIVKKYNSNRGEVETDVNRERGKEEKGRHRENGEVMVQTVHLGRRKKVKTKNVSIKGGERWP